MKGNDNYNYKHFIFTECTVLVTLIRKTIFSMQNLLRLAGIWKQESGRENRVNPPKRYHIHELVPVPYIAGIFRGYKLSPERPLTKVFVDLIFAE